MRRRALVHDGAKLSRGGIDDRRRAGDFDDIGRTAQLQGDVQSEDLVKVQHYSLTDIFLETLEGEIDFVTADRHFNENVFAIRAGQCFARGVGALVDQLHGGGRYRAAARVHHRAADAAAGALRAGQRHGQAQGHGQDGFE